MAEQEDIGFGLAPGSNKPGHGDTDGVESQHWSGEKAHIQDVGGGSDDCRDDKNDEDGVPHICQHPSSRDDTHQSQEEHEDWHFENQPKAEDDCHKQLCIFPNRYHGLKALAITDQEVQGSRIDHLVTEQTSGYEQSNRTQ